MTSAVMTTGRKITEGEQPRQKADDPAERHARDEQGGERRDQVRVGQPASRKAVTQAQGCSFQKN
jgi:hypothetical protein